MRSRYVKDRTAVGSWCKLVRFPGLIALTLGCLACAFPAQAKSNDKLRLIMKDKRVYVYQLKKWAKCADTVKFLTIASDPSIYKGDRVHLQKIAGGVRAVTSITCKRMKAMSIVGFLGKEVAYTGIASASGGWRLKTVPVKKNSGTTSSGNKKRTPTAKASPKASPKAVPAPINPAQDKNFFAALAQAEEPEKPTVQSGQGNDHSNRDDGDQVAALPPDTISDAQRRDGISYRKLSGDLPQLMDMSSADMLKSCIKIGKKKNKPGDADILALRVCRALAYSAGQYDLAVKIEGRLDK